MHLSKGETGWLVSSPSTPLVGNSAIPCQHSFFRHIGCFRFPNAAEGPKNLSGSNRVTQALDLDLPISLLSFLLPSAELRQPGLALSVFLQGNKVTPGEPPFTNPSVVITLRS